MSGSTAKTQEAEMPFAEKLGIGPQTESVFAIIAREQ